MIEICRFGFCFGTFQCQKNLIFYDGGWTWKENDSKLETMTMICDVWSCAATKVTAVQNALAVFDTV